MSKKGISQIKGPSEIRLGETAYYEVSRIYDLDDKKKVDAARWKLYALDFKHHGNWRELTPKAGTPPKIGYRVPVIVTNQSLVGSELMLEAYIYEPEKRIPPGLRIKVLPGIEKKITRVDLFKVDDTPIKDDTVMKYGQTIKVKVYTQNMQNEMMKLSLYEDDAQGGGDSPKNKNNRVAYIKKPLNKKGFLVHEFKLNIDFTKIANAMMDGSHDKLHEYYVVVETAEHKSVSKNVEVQNLDYVKVQNVSSGVDTEKIYEGIVIEEVIVKRKFKKQIGTNPPVNAGNKVVTVAKPDEKEKKIEEVCECEAKVRAFIRMIRKGEGTIDDGGYSRIVGGYNFKDYNKDFSTHPQVYIKAHNSTAAGAYQITKTNWNSEEFVKWRTDNDINDFSPESQDIYCAYLIIKKKNAFSNINIDDIEGAINKCSKEWASLPGAGYGQREEKLEVITKLYDKFLKEELSGQIGLIAKLHIKPGFLKRFFGYKCCEGNNENKSSLKKGYDIEKAVAKLNANVEAKSLSACAKYVRIAIEAGGLSTNGRPISAKNYDTFLPKLGFKEISKTNYTPIKGDIVVIQSINGHPHGHICMYNGSQWLSDFKQRDMWPGSSYRNNPPRYNIYRWK